ncbi:MAG: ATP synthase F1 subunit delta [Actinobacteria bacterium]|nr:ATP synthase F1 subunit delta [Actinomycetota bacterium]
MRRGGAQRRRRVRAYVAALVAQAQRDGAWDAWEADLRVLRALTQDRDTRAFLEYPALPRDQRLQAVARVAGPGLGPGGLGILRIMIERRDTALAAEIERVFVRAADEARRLDRIQVTSATPLSEAAVHALDAQLATPGRVLRLTTVVDPRVVGGLVIRSGDTVWDFSVRARLHALATALR